MRTKCGHVRRCIAQSDSSSLLSSTTFYLYLLSSAAATAAGRRDDFFAFFFSPPGLSLGINDMSCGCFVYANKYIIKWEKKLHTADEWRRRRHDRGMSVEWKKKGKKFVWQWDSSAEKRSCDFGCCERVFRRAVPNGIAGRRRRQGSDENQMRVQCEVPIMCLFIDIMTLWCQWKWPSSAFGQCAPACLCIIINSLSSTLHTKSHKMLLSQNKLTIPQRKVFGEAWPRPSHTINESLEWDRARSLHFMGRRPFD